MLIWLINRIRTLWGLEAKYRILALLLLVIIFGSIAFYCFENGEEPVEDIWDAVYWVTVTITTVGYGDITPKTTGGRITFVLVALGGIGTITYMIEQLVSFSTKGQLRKLFGSGVMKMKKHTIIVGWNARAEEAINELKIENNDFLVVGSQLNQVELETLNIPHISGDATKNETLNRCNIKDAKTIMIPLGNDSETVMIALAARRLNPGIKIVATCETREHVEMMRGAGIEHIISHAEIGGRLLAHAVTEPIVMKFIINAMTSAGGFNLEQIKVDKKSKLSDISINKNKKIIALYMNDGFVFDFTADVLLEKEDYLVVVSSSS